jgi:hypothetical protein
VKLSEIGYGRGMVKGSETARVLIQGLLYVRKEDVRAWCTCMWGGRDDVRVGAWVDVRSMGFVGWLDGSVARGSRNGETG